MAAAPSEPAPTGAAPRTALAEVSATGAFVRTAAGWRAKIGDPGFEPESGRYHLYVSLACPWACRCLAALYIKGLESAIGVSVVHPTWQRTRPGVEGDAHAGWAFVSPGDPPLSSPAGYGSFACDERCVPDAVNGARFVRDLYELAGDATGKYSVPVLWDKKRRTIVSNESSEIVRMLNADFNAFAAHPGRDLYPEPLRPAIDAANSWVYEAINDGVYRCGFAKAQAPYEAACAALFAALDRCEGILARRRYLAGGAAPTEADVRLFVTLVRHDDVYASYFKANARLVRDYVNLRAYVRDVYRSYGGAVARSVDISHIKTHYWTSHPALNAYAVVPVGGPRWWEEPPGAARAALP